MTTEQQTPRAVPVLRRVDQVQRRGTRRKLALRLYNDGYHAGHHDTVEGRFSDDTKGADAEYYHGDSVSEILKEDEKEKGRCQMSEKQEQQQPVPCPFCGEEWERQPPRYPEYPDEYEWWHPSGECWNTRLFDTSYLAASQVPAYNAACAKMRERVIESIEPRICMASAVCPNCQAGIEMVSLPSTLAKDGAK